MKILALDTSSEGCSAALLVADAVTSRFETAPRGHTQRIMPMVRELLAEGSLKPSDLDAVAFARGPGSFTGVRIATGVVQGLAYGLGLPVVPVSSLQAVAAQAIDQMALSGNQGVAVAFDARMQEVYWACFRATEPVPELLGVEQVLPPSNVELDSSVGQWAGAGSGWAMKEQFPAEVVERVEPIEVALTPRSDWVVRLAAEQFRREGGVSAHEAQPVYIRDEVAWQKLPGR